MMKLGARDFPEFFRAIHGFDPFPWQVRLVEQLETDKHWPRGLALPTGSGKTTAIDAAVFSLACELSHGGDGYRRTMPTRIVFVVDRRIIVDAAYTSALSLRDKLQTSDNAIVRAVRDALETVAESGYAVLHVERLRGGVPRERDWTPSPAHATVLLSTVDQVGSRLLFRGYGVSESMRPVHAGLLGTDALILLDEVHLSEPFRQTLRSIENMRGKTALPWAAVELSATPRGAGDDVLRLTDEDRAHPVLQMRLTARKPADVVNVPDDDISLFAERFVREAIGRSILGNGEHSRILIIVNRVALARVIHGKLRAAVVNLTVPVELLIGRAREIDSDARRQRISNEMGTRSASASTTEEPYFLVATQTIEAGADVDFDVLITQIAPLDTLRQRFGRLDRSGFLGQNGRTGSAVVISGQQEVAKEKSDPIYGDALRATWDWLRENKDAQSQVDFGIDTMDTKLSSCDPKLLASLSSPSDDAPTLMPSYVVVLEQTRPTPKPDLPIDLFLHGPHVELADVSIVWRGDLSMPIASDAQRTATILDALPPRASEAIALPIWVVRRWLAERRTRRLTRLLDDIGDVSARRNERTDDRRFAGDAAAWRWDGDGKAEAIAPNSVRPGDLLVVPSEYGGCDKFGWAPTSEASVIDVADAAALPYVGSSFAVRLHPNLLQNEMAHDAGSRDDQLDERAVKAWKALLNSVGSDVEPRDIAERLSANTVLPATGATLASLKLLAMQLNGPTSKGINVLLRAPYGSDAGDRSAGFLLVVPRGLPVTRQQRPESINLEAVTEDDERATLGSGTYLLLEHGNDVEAGARATAAQLRLPSAIVDDVALAGWFHDAGKSDLRFQRYLQGSRWLLDDKLLAKSLEPRDRQADKQARHFSALPERWRHEALSVRIARVHPDFKNANDPELVLWLIGVHHGWGRPLFPNGDPLDGKGREIKGYGETLYLNDDHAPHSPEFRLQVVTADGMVDVSWPLLGRRLAMRYGSWDLALLETIVRLADHRASAARSRAVVR